MKAAVLTALISALVLGVAGCGGGSRATSTTPPPGVQVHIVVKGGEPVGGVKRATIHKGAAVLIRVKSDVADEIHLHGYDLSAPVDAGGTATIEFLADITGRFELELENRGVQIADLTVQ